MILRHRVALNGIQLDEVDPAVLVLGVAEEAAARQQTAVNQWAVGQRLTANRLNYIDVTVTFAVRIKKSDMQGHTRVFGAVSRWANTGGYLTASHRDGQRIRVACVGISRLADPVKWETEYTITFRAYERPFWEDVREWVDTVSGTTFVHKLPARGTQPTQLDLYLKNTTSGIMNTLTVSTDEDEMEFEDLSLGPGKILAITHSETGLLVIKNSTNTSLMTARTLESSDDLTLRPGLNTITVTAQCAAEATFRYRGRWY